MSNFWRNWMNVWCGAIGLFGIVLVGGSLDITSVPVRFLFNLLNRSDEFVLTPHLRFSLIVLGAVTIGWSLTLFAAIQAVHQLDKPSSKTIWMVIALSVMSWYIIDSSLSIATGFWLNAIANTSFIVTFLIPVLGSGVLVTQKPDHLQ
ncbi:MAG: hypothetical protein NW220_07780 [Leptolyngbyaceae cyanobacterium bins.349]|nr:hypothetical protein [Leptolyngbyaceae cyanobacterium bins.349]